MPDHVHLVVSASTADLTPNRLSEIVASIKSVSARRINELLMRKGHVWQEESFDHCIRSDESLNAKMAYVLNNPVRGGLVERARDYKWVWTADPLFMENFLK
jgi:REP element-mobilizing transposase RayT